MDELAITQVLLALWEQSETSVAQLAEETGMPAERVNEALDALQRRKCLIERTPNGGGGVRLAATGLAAWRDILENQARIRGWRIGKKLLVLAKTGSTNDVAWELAATAEADGSVVCADEQTAGRGRFGHTWDTKAEQSVLMSVLLRSAEGTNAIDELTLLAGLATARAVEKFAPAGADGVQIKWPNDVLVNGKKIAGILVERRADFCVIGIGLNVGQRAEDFHPNLRARATSLYEAAGVMVDRLRVVAAAVEELDRWIFKDRPADWVKEWKARCGMLGQRVKALSAGEVIDAVVVDVDPMEGLLVRMDSGALRMLPAQATTLTL